jgi:SAM-dependent methyltransferase
MFAQHAGNLDSARASAEVIVPLVVNLIRPRSAVDVGCGTGGWVQVLVEHGVTDVLGVDGGELSGSLLEAARYRQMDLGAGNVMLDRKFELAICLEVAEHLPVDAAVPLVASLVRLSDVVLFSAAIPGQLGPGHQNEQWPSYWAEKFRHHGFSAYDVIRPKVWDNSGVAWWYRQNMLLFARRPPGGHNPALAVDLVHPELFVRALRRGTGVRSIPRIVARSITKRLGG